MTPDISYRETDFDQDGIIDLVGSLVWIHRKRPNEIKQMKGKIKAIRKQLTILEKELQ